MREHRKSNLLREFHTFKMHTGESVSDCQSRFTILVDKLSATGTTIPLSQQANQVIYAMGDKYELTRRVALMSKDIRTLPVADVFGKFLDQELTDREQENVAAEVKGHALKLTRVLEKMENKEADEDDDVEVAMMTNIVKRFFKNRTARQGATSSAPQGKQDNRDLSTYVCYNCQQKGHLAKTCTNPKVEPAAENKALFSSWGEDNDESDLCENLRGICFMAHEETLQQVNTPAEFFSHLHVLKKEDLIDMIKELMEDNSVVEKESTEYATEIRELRSENLDLSTRLADKEQNLQKLKGMILKTKSCEGCKGKQPQGTVSSNFQATTESSLAMIMDKLEKLATSIDEKTVNQTVFVKARPGLGFSEDASTLSPQDKLNMELTEKADKLSKELHKSKSQNEYLAAKVKVLETEPATNKT